MDLFLYLCIGSIGLVVSGKSIVKLEERAQQSDESDPVKLLNIAIICGRLNQKYGKLLLITGGVGLLFYHTLGLLVFGSMVLLLLLYLGSVAVNGYKFIQTESDSYRKCE